MFIFEPYLFFYPHIRSKHILHTEHRVQNFHGLHSNELQYNTRHSREKYIIYLIKIVKIYNDVF
jgi:hypothetical protein